VSTAPVITESDLLAFIEDAPMSPETARAVERAFAADPSLAASCRARRRDRLALLRLANAERAPGGAVARALAAAGSERPVLAKPVLAKLVPAGHSGPQVIPVSRIGPVSEPWWEVVVRSPRLRPALAAAAVVAIVAGVGVLLYGAVAGRPQPPRPLASGGEATALPVVVPTLPPVVVADALPPEPGPAAGEPTPEQTAVAAVAAEPELTDERLLELAMSGRLAVRLRTAEVGSALAQVRLAQARPRVFAVAALSGVERSMILGDLGQQRLAAKVGTSPAETNAGASRPLTPEGEPVLASGEKNHAGNHAGSPRPPVAVPAGVPSLTEPVFAAEAFALQVPADVEVLRQMLRWLSSEAGGRSVSAVFQPLSRPAVGAVVPAADAADVLWWTQPSNAWTPRITVPVIIQTTP
jgi:hypothetical protein